MRTALFSTAYFAPVQYYSHLNRTENPVIEACEHYIKQTWRNRCVIGTANGPMTLSLPIENDKSRQSAIRDIRLSDHGNWKHLHWYSIESAYNSSPFFEYYQDDLRPFFEQKNDFLFDFNESIRMKICELIGISATVSYSKEYVKGSLLPSDCSDYRTLIHPKNEAHMVDPSFMPSPYYQVFERKFGFQPNLSILDLLFNMGPEAILYL